MTEAGESQASSADREIVTMRLIDAPRRLVFKAWTDPDHLARWWGPKGFTNTFHEFDPRPGGAWRLVMHGPDGVDYTNESVFRELVEAERIVFVHLRPMHRFQVTATFADEVGKTRLVWRMLFDSVSECEKVKGFVIEANEQNLDRLETELATMT
jgi:uncharacterized protein YndB with AHSA1/START domain